MATAKYLTYMKTCGRAGQSANSFPPIPLCVDPNPVLEMKSICFRHYARETKATNRCPHFYTDTGNFDRGDERVIQPLTTD